VYTRAHLNPHHGSWRNGHSSSILGSFEVVIIHMNKVFGVSLYQLSTLRSLRETKLRENALVHLTSACRKLASQAKNGVMGLFGESHLSKDLLCCFEPPSAVFSIRDFSDRYEDTLSAFVETVQKEDLWQTNNRIDEILTRLHYFLASVRVLKKHETFLRTPDSELSSCTSSALAQTADIFRLAQGTSDDAYSFCIEKRGASPKINVTLERIAKQQNAQPQQESQLLALCFPTAVHFALMEVLKNSQRALADRYGRDFDTDAPPISVHVSCGASPLPVQASAAHVDVYTGSVTGASSSEPPQQLQHHAHIHRSDEEVGIRVRDSGLGMTTQARTNALSWLHTTTPPQPATYTYGGGFGAQFSGIGVGLNMAAVCMAQMGGRLQLASLPGAGTEGVLSWPRRGDYADSGVPPAWLLYRLHAV